MKLFKFGNDERGMEEKKKEPEAPETVTLGVGDKYFVNLNETDVAIVLNSGRLTLSVFYSQWTHGGGRIVTYGYPIYLRHGGERFQVGRKSLTVSRIDTETDRVDLRVEQLPDKK